MKWHKVILSDADITAHKHLELQNEFTGLWFAAGGPKDAGMFTSTDSHDYFFSPGAVSMAVPILARYGSVECSAPTKSEANVSLIAPSECGEIPFA
jgi:hypothetical protein